MSAYVPCAGSGQTAVNLERFPSVRDGLGMTRAKTFGKCRSCDKVVMEYGTPAFIKVARHKPRERES